MVINGANHFAGAHHPAESSSLLERLCPWPSTACCQWHDEEGRRLPSTKKITNRCLGPVLQSYRSKFVVGQWTGMGEERRFPGQIWGLIAIGSRNWSSYKVAEKTGERRGSGGDAMLFFEAGTGRGIDCPWFLMSLGRRLKEIGDNVAQNTTLLLYGFKDISFRCPQLLLLLYWRGHQWTDGFDSGSWSDG